MQLYYMMYVFGNLCIEGMSNRPCDTSTRFETDTRVVTFLSEKVFLSFESKVQEWYVSSSYILPFVHDSKYIHDIHTSTINNYLCDHEVYIVVSLQACNFRESWEHSMNCVEMWSCWLMCIERFAHTLVVTRLHLNLSISYHTSSKLEKWIGFPCVAKMFETLLWWC